MVQDEINQGVEIPTKEQLERWGLMLINGTSEVLCVSHLDPVTEDYVLFELNLQDEDPIEDVDSGYGGSDESTLDAVDGVRDGEDHPKKSMSLRRMGSIESTKDMASVLNYAFRRPPI